MDKIAYADPQNIIFSLEVKDLERAAKFYKEILGFERGWEGGLEIGWLEIIIPDETLILGLSRRKDRVVKYGSTTINFGAKYTEATKAYLDSKDVKTMDLHEIPNMIKMVMAFDPGGNVLCFVESLIEE